MTDSSLGQQNPDYMEMVQRITDGFFAIDANWKFTYINSAACRLLGKSSEEVVGKCVWDAFSPALISPFYDECTKAMTEQLPVAFQAFYSPLDTWFEVRAYPSNGGLSVLLQDATERYRDVKERNEETLQLRQSEERLAASQRIAHVGSWELDIPSGLGHCSEEVFHILGIPPRADGVVPLDSIYASILLQDRELVKDAVEKAQYGFPIQVEVRIVRPNGEMRYVRVQQQRDEQTGMASRYMGMIQDITEHKQLERMLQVSQERYQSLKKYNPEAVVSLNLNGKFTGANPAVERLLGYSLDELLQMHAADLVFAEDRDRIHQYIRPALEGVVSGSIETRFRHKAGHAVEVDATCVPIIVHQKLVGLYIIAQNITERKRIEQKLHESEQRYKSLIEYNPDGVCALDFEGNIIDSNPALQNLVGYENEELLQMKYRDLLVTYPGTSKAPIPGDFSAQREMVHASIRRKNGEQIECMLRTVPIFVDGETVGQYVIARDVTRQNQMEELLRKSEKLSAVGQLAAGVAHEIRNPLTALKGFIQIMNTSGTMKAEYLSIMEDELSRIELISSELLVLGKPQANEFRPRDVRKLLESVVLLLETQAIIKNVQIQKQYDDNLSMVDCDENQLKQVFINIMKNAIEAMSDGGKLTIQAQNLSSSELQVSFIDTGKGIPAELITKLGEPFYTTKEKGTGLGLMVTQKIVENHRGTIAYQSQVGEGTTVHVRLPMLDSASVIPVKA